MKPSLLLRWLLGAGLLHSGLCWGQAPALNAPKLDSLLTALAAHQQAMGSLTIRRAGRVLYSHSFGVAQMQPRVPATAATRYRADYLERLCTEVLLFQLLEAGRLTLTTPLARFFPQLPRARTITIDDLRSQRSGLSGSLTYDPAHPLTQRQVLVRLSDWHGSGELRPGQYAVDAEYLVLRYIIEQLTGQPFAQAVRQRLVAKAGLAHTYFTTALRPQQQEALPYEWRGTGWQLAPRSLGGLDGRGVLVTTAADVSQLLAALYEGRLVSAASRTAMQSGRDGMPRVLYTTTLAGTPLYTCTGGQDRLRAGAYYFPGPQVAVSLLLNGLHSSYPALESSVLRASLGQPYRLPTFAPPFVPDPADLARCLGTYAGDGPLRFTVVRDGPTLRLESAREGHETLVPVGPGEFRTRTGRRLWFSADRQQFQLSDAQGTYLFSRR